MSVGFGFAVGDIIAVLKLVGTVTDALRESSNATNSFRDLINELYALENAILAVKRLDADIKHVQRVALEQAAIQCQRTIDHFYQKIRKLQPHLQAGGTDSRLKDAWEKVKWATCKKSDVETFRAQIRGHTSSIDILLLTIQMEASSTQAKAQISQHKSLAGRMQDFSCRVMSRLNAITIGVAQSAQQGKALLESSAKVVQTNLRIFQVIHDIQLFILKVPGQIQRQQPVYLIDPLNRESPFYLEFVRSPEALLAVLKINLKDTGCGPTMIDQGEFVIEESGTGNILDFSTSWDCCFYPGQRVAMSMVFKQQWMDDRSSCPRCRQIQDEVVTKEVTCQSCGIVFRRVEETNEKSNHIKSQDNGTNEEIPLDLQETESQSKLTIGPEHPLKLKEEAMGDFKDLRKFRRLWISCRPAYECPFWFLSCSYTSYDQEEWRTHCFVHFRGEEPPKSVQCPLCDFKYTCDNGWTAWNSRMEHVASHHLLGIPIRASRPDFHLFTHLWRKRLIDDQDLKELKGGNHNLRNPPRNFTMTKTRYGRDRRVARGEKRKHIGLRPGAGGPAG